MPGRGQSEAGRGGIVSLIGVVLAEEVLKDGPGLVRAVVEAFGGGQAGAAKVQAILAAEYATTDAAVDALEAEAVAKESAP